MPTYVEPLFRPPSEANSLIFQITIGCSQNSCTFCGMYKMKRFRMKPVDEVLAEIDSIPVRYRPQVDRVFLADGDALVYPQDGLSAVLAHLGRPSPTSSGSAPMPPLTASVPSLRKSWRSSRRHG